MRKILLAAASLLALASAARADSTVTALTAASALTGAELYYCVQGAADRKCTATQLQTYVNTAPTMTGITTLPALTLSGVTGSIQCLHASATGVVTGTGSDCGAGGGGGVPLTGNGATIVASTPLIDVSQTWNNAAVTFTGIRENITSTLSAAGSLLLDLQVGGSSKFNVDATGAIRIGGSANANFTQAGGNLFIAASGGVIDFGGSNFQVGSAGTSFFGVQRFNKIGWAAGSSVIDTWLISDAAGIIAQVNSTTPQTYRAYNTFTDINNYERGVIDWTTAANTLTIGTQAAGTGNLRQIALNGGGVTHLMTAPDAAHSASSWFMWNHTNSGSGIGTLGLSSLITGGNIDIIQSGAVDSTWYTNCAMELNQIGATLCAGIPLRWMSGVDLSSPVVDTGIIRSAAGLIEINNGTTGTLRDLINRHQGGGGPPPTVGTCAGFALSTGSSDLAGRVTFTSGTSCSITFGTAFTNAPFCTVTPGSAVSTAFVTTSTTVMTVTFGTANSAMQYTCHGL